MNIFFKFVSFLLYPTNVTMLKCAMLGAFSVINKKIKNFGMNTSFISSREARKGIFQIVASPLMKCACFVSLDEIISFPCQKFKYPLGIYELHIA